MHWFLKDRVLRGWLWGLGLLPGLGILIWSSYPLSRRLGLVLFGLIAFGGFAWARFRLDRTLQGQSHWDFPGKSYRLLSFPLDLFMVVQLLAARGAAEGHWMGGPGFMWVGPVW